MSERFRIHGNRIVGRTRDCAGRSNTVTSPARPTLEEMNETNRRFWARDRQQDEGEHRFTPGSWQRSTPEQKLETMNLRNRAFWGGRS